MPKPTRSSSGQLRSHSRSSSGTRLGANLQFTAAAKDVQPAKQPPSGGKKGGAGAQPQTGVYDALNHDIMFAVAHHGAKPPFVRANSSQRVHSREQLARRLAPLQQPPPAQQQQQQQYAKTNGKAFSIQAQAVDAAEDDEDEWESENGAATPNQDDSGSDTASENGPDQEFPDQVAPQQQYPEQQQLDPRRQPPAMTAQQEQIMAQQRKEAEMQHQLYLRQRQLEAQHRQQQKVDQERHLLQQQQQQQEQYQQELRLQQQRQIQAQQQQQQQHQYQQQQQNRQLQQQEQQQLYLQQQQQQQQLYQQQHPPHIQTGFPVAESELARVNTARPSDFEHALRSERPTPRTTTPSKHQQQEPAQPQPPQRQQTTPQPQPSTDQPSKDRRPHTPRSDSEPFHQTASATGDTSEAARHSPRPKHISRPPSSHSIRSDHGLRPHPLFRGLTQGVSNPVPRPAPLAPLTVLPASTALPAISTSPPTSIIESLNGRQHLSSSPTTSIRTSSGSPAGSEPPYSAFAPGRRMSISSARSAASTLPPQSASGRETVWTHDRTRTLSTMSTASSSAALSSLANLPSVTRPPSPQTIAFFPPVNPHSNVEAIHPLLPGPYLHNHLTVLSRRTPIRESFDRVMRAKNAR